MEIDPTLAAASQAQAMTLAWPEAPEGPSGADWYLVRLEERHSLGDAAPGDGVWLGNDLLASPSRLAGSWGLAKPS